MSYLKFDKALMINLEESLTREILRVNQSGAYHCTTIVDCHTRKYHGLLVMPVPELDDENHVLLSSLDETVVQHDAEFNLALHRYEGEHFSPNGHKYIRGFNVETVPETTYRVGGVVLKKEKMFIQHESQILIRYTLLEAHSPTKLRLRPFLAFRSVKSYSHENCDVDQSYQEIHNGIKTCLYKGYPSLQMQLNKKNEFKYNPAWYKGLEYTKELERGNEGREDLYVPGYFEVDIKKGESIIFSAGVVECNTRTLKKSFDDECAERTPRDSFFNCLKNSAHQFHNRQGGKHYLLAGYPWFKCRARDMFISLPGLTLGLDEIDAFESVMQTAQEAINHYLKGEPIACEITEMEHPDVLLWAVWALQQYAKTVSREECMKKYGVLLHNIIQFIEDQKHPNLQLHDNGLLYTNGKEKAVTWMNATVYGKPVTPRTGYIVEINALWYNALRFVADLNKEAGHDGVSEQLDDLAKQTATSFVDTFRNEYGYLLDYVDGSMMDWSVRPNMIFAIAFDYSPLDRVQRKEVLDYVTKELLTPKGIRTLSPKSMGYNPNYVGRQVERDYAYHQGTAWPWLLGFYLEAYLKIYRTSGLSFVDRMMIGMEDEMSNHCLSTLSELYDGNPPFKGRGAISFAMNVAEVLRINKLKSKYNF